MTLPITIINNLGERLTFQRLTTNEAGQQILEVENEVAPKAGPPMHVHWRQDECITVEEGRLGYQIAGEEPKFAGPGESILFKAGTFHKFWNDGDTVLRGKGWVSPPDNIVYFLSKIYESANENGGRPGTFDSAFLLNRYKTEFAMSEIPAFVQQYIFPISLFFGRLQGKHKKFADAPEPVV